MNSADAQALRERPRNFREWTRHDCYELVADCHSDEKVARRVRGYSKSPTLEDVGREHWECTTDFIKCSNSRGDWTGRRKDPEFWGYGY